MITVCIPYYSGLAYLRRALDSVVAQSCDQWRAIVCDDRGPEALAVDHGFQPIANHFQCLFSRPTLSAGLEQIDFRDPEPAVANYCAFESHEK
jgi:hypothetical protein